MNSHELISVYEAVASVTGRMLAAARAGDWDQLIVLETHCAAHVATLKAEDPRTSLPEDMRNRKVQLIHRILDDDRQIRSLTEPWMAQLSRLIDSTGVERKLAQTYGAQQTG